jgi:uncharacterized protein involved in oxidation of intracellular sulfur
VFLINDGVECEYINNNEFKVPDKIKEFLDNKGTLFACKSCLEKRNIDIPRFANIGNLANLHNIITESDRVISF